MKDLQVTTVAFAARAKHPDVLSTLKQGKLTDEVTDTLTAVCKDLAEKYKD